VRGGGGAGQKHQYFHRNVNAFYSSSMRFISGQVSSQLKLVRLQHEHIIVSNQISMVFTFSSAAGAALARLQVTMSIFSWENLYIYSLSMRLVGAQVSSQLKLVRLQHEIINISIDIPIRFDIPISGRHYSGEPSSRKC
jgi:hypothetical protein